LNFLNKKISENIGFKEIWQNIEPVSELGMRAKKKFTPFLKKEEKKLKSELDKLEIVIAVIKKEESDFYKLKNLLKEVKNIFGIVNQSRNKKTVLDDIDIFEIKKNIIQTKKIKLIIESLNLNYLFASELEEFPELLKYLSLGQSDSESFYLADDYDKNLQEIRERRQKIEKNLIQEQKKLSAEIERKAKRPFSADNEISVSKNDKEIIDFFKKSKEVSLVSENFAALTFKLIENEKISQLKSEINKIKKKEEIQKNIIRKKITNKISKKSLDLMDNLDKIAYLDFILAKAEFSIEISACKPELNSNEFIRIKKGRHILIDKELEKKGMSFTPIDLEIREGATLITGPNMGGKTVSLKLVALLTAMAQHALFVPATSFNFNIRNYIYFSLTSDNIKTGLSKFGTEISNLKFVIESANNNGLILIDEIAHGTNPAEGYAIAYGIINKLDNMQSISVITTHYQRLADQLKITHLQVKGLDKKLLSHYHNYIKENGIDVLNKCMDYHLEKVETGTEFPQDAIQIAEILGFDAEILRTAKEIMEK
jgi:DNA mismatch repair ATPase MutS